MTDENREEVLTLLWASMSSLQLTTDPYMSVLLMQEAVAKYGNSLVQKLTAELLIADKSSAQDIKVVKSHLIFGLFNKMDAWLAEEN